MSSSVRKGRGGATFPSSLELPGTDSGGRSTGITTLQVWPSSSCSGCVCMCSDEREIVVVKMRRGSRGQKEAGG